MDDFHSILIDDIEQNSAINSSSSKQELFNIYIDYLVESDIFNSDCVYLDYEASLSGNKKCAISGYYYNNFDAELILFIVPEISFDEVNTLNKNSVDKYISRVKNFFFYSSEIVKYGEESTEGYDLAYQIVSRKEFEYREFFNLSSLKIVILTDMKKSSTLKKIDEEYIGDLKITFDIFDLDRIRNIRDSKTGKEDLVIDLMDYKKNTSFKGIPCFLANESEEYDSYLCNFNGLILAEIFNQYGSRLLEGNVRSFLQFKGKINKGIRETVLNSPNRFFAYNNGLTVTCDDLEINKGFITKINNMQIVNGGQTTATLGSCLLNDAKKFDIISKLSEISVSMKLNVIKSLDNVDDLIADISKYANSQNKVNDIDLMSNHPFHRRIEDLSRKILAPAVNGQQYGTYWYYERANGQFAQEQSKLTKAQKENFLREHPKSQMFKKQDLSKYHCILNLFPYVAVQGSGPSFKKFSEWILGIWDKNDAKINEQYYKEMISTIILFKSIDKIVNSSDWYSNSGYKSQIVTYTLSYFYHYIDNIIHRSFDFNKVWKNQKINPILSDFFEELSSKIYNYLILEDRSVENVKNWVRNKECWDNLKEKTLVLETDISEYLISNEARKEDNINATKEMKDDKKISDTIFVYEKLEENEEYYIKLTDFIKELNLLSDKEKSILKIITNQTGMLSDSQCKIVRKIIEKAEIEGFTKNNM